MTDKFRVLILATNQLELAYVRLGDEMREIENRIHSGSLGDSFDLIPKSAVRVSDLGMFLLRHKPHIVHLTGHGRPSEGIILEDEAGNIWAVGAEELAGILQTAKDDLRIAFLNVCYSKVHAEALVKVIDYAIGMDGVFEDNSAITFAASFYQALAFGRSVKEAFEAAKKELNVRGLPGSGIPALLVRQGVDVSEPLPIKVEDVEGVEESKLAVKRLIDGIASPDDRIAIQHKVAGGRIILDKTEDDPVSENDAQETISITVRDSQLHIMLSPSAYQQVKDRLFPPPPGIAPPLPHSVFIGREGAIEDVKMLLDNKKGSTGRSSITVVRGWPGVGKTSLVGVIGRDPDIAKMFPQGVLWTSLEQKPNLLSEMASWGRALGSDEILRAPTLKEATAHLANLLRHRRMLLILDDIWETAHTVPFAEALGEQCRLLVTTRMTSVAEDLTLNEEEIYILPVLTEEDSLKLLRILAPSVAEQYQDECRELVRDLECLPLALHVAGRLLKSEVKLGWGVADLICEIREGAKLFPEPAPNDRIQGEQIPTVSALLMRSTDMLDDFTRDCFAYLGAFAPKPATFDLAAMKAVWEVDDPKPIVRRLVGHGLLEPAGSGRFQMHRILVDHARSLCSD
jgi:hypothetical protein